MPFIRLVASFILIILKCEPCDLIHFFKKKKIRTGCIENSQTFILKGKTDIHMWLPNNLTLLTSIMLTIEVRTYLSMNYISSSFSLHSFNLPILKFCFLEGLFKYNTRVGGLNLKPLVFKNKQMLVELNSWQNFTLKLYYNTLKKRLTQITSNDQL